MTMRRVVGVAVLTSLSALTSGARSEVEGAQRESAAATMRTVLAPLPEPRVDMTKVALGRRLFFDTSLSGDGTVSCASCHSFDHGGAEPRATSLGIGGAIGPINASTVLNASLNFVQFWDGRAADLREQARAVVTNPIEMGSSFERVVAALTADPTYVAAFRAPYPDGITEANIVDAIAEYETALITPAPFDRFLRGDETALSADERAGYKLFMAVGCTSCHRGANLGGTMYQRLGVVREYFGPDLGRPLTEADNGRFNVTQKDSRVLGVPDLSDTAVLISEFGAVALDHHLLEAAVDDIVELPNGCTCCAVRQGLADAFYRLLRSRQAAGRPPFRRIALETSGLADPGPTLYTLSADAFLEASLRLDRVVTTIDAVLGAATLDRYPEAVAQAAVADLLLLTKTDMAPVPDVLVRRLASLNPLAPIVDAGEADVSAVLFAGSPKALPRPRLQRHGGPCPRHLRPVCPLAAADEPARLCHGAGRAGARSRREAAARQGTGRVLRPAWRSGGDPCRAAHALSAALAGTLARLRPGQPACLHRARSRAGRDPAPLRRRRTGVPRPSGRSDLMLDLAITGGTCVLPTGTQAADIGVKDGRIVLVGGPGSLPEAARTVPAKDRLVIPGGIDPHIHCLMPVRAPGRPDVLTDPPSQVSKAALHGGTTTLIDFVQCVHERTIQQSIEATQAQWRNACYCDYGFHLTLMGEVPVPHFGQLADAMQDGHASIKIFTTNIRPGNIGRMVPHGHIWEALKVVAAAGGIACIHAEDNDIVMFMYEKLMRENRVSFEHMAEVHNALSEELSFNRVIRLAENVEGAALYMVHVSAATGVAALEVIARPRLPDVRRDAAPVPALQRRGL